MSESVVTDSSTLMLSKNHVWNKGINLSHEEVQELKKKVEVLEQKVTELEQELKMKEQTQVEQTILNKESSIQQNAEQLDIINANSMQKSLEQNEKTFITGPQFECIMNKLEHLTKTIEKNENRRKQETSKMDGQLHVLLKKVIEFQEKESLQDFINARPKHDAKKRHQVILQANAIVIVRDIAFNQTTLFDVLLSSQAILKNDYDKIMAKTPGTERNRCLLMSLYHGTEKQFETFLKTLQREIPHLHEKLEKDFSEDSDVNPQCLVCRIRTEVNLNAIAESLLQHDLMDIVFYEYLLSPNTQSYAHKQQEIWTHIFKKVDSLQNVHRENKMALLLEILNEQPNFEINILDKQYIASVFECFCVFQFSCNSSKASFKSSFNSLSSFRQYSGNSFDSAASFSSLDDTRFYQEQRSGGDPVSKKHLPMVNSVNTELPRTLEWVESVDPNQLPSGDSSDMDNILAALNFDPDAQKTSETPTPMKEPGMNDSGYASSTLLTPVSQEPKEAHTADGLVSTELPIATEHPEGLGFFAGSKSEITNYTSEVINESEENTHEYLSRRKKRNRKRREKTSRTSVNGAH